METIPLNVLENSNQIPLSSEQIREVEAVSPSVALERVSDGVTITVRDLHGEHSEIVYDGPKGETGPRGEQGEPGQPGKDGAVQDVQINGTSILHDGVVNVPLASDTQFGVVARGLGLWIDANNRLVVDFAGVSQVKAGGSIATALCPGRQHTSTFYGLAKAAGDSTQSQSANAVGTYTDEAKAAIRKMLGMQNNTWELIFDYTLSEDSDTVIIDTDVNGQPFLLDKLVARIFLKANATGQDNFFYANAQGINDSGTTTILAAPTGRWPSNGTDGFCELYIEKIADFVKSDMRRGSTTFSNAQSVYSSSSAILNGLMGMNAITLRRYNASSSPITAGTRIMLYGIRSDE